MVRRAAGSRRLPTALRVALALFLVPVVMFANPTQAAAATWTGLSFNFPGASGGTGNIECWVAVALDGNTFRADNGECWGGMDISPGWKQRGEWGTDYTIEVRSGDAGSYPYWTGQLHQGSEDSWQSLHSTFGGVSLVLPEGYDPALVCLTITDPSGTAEWLCNPVNLDPEPVTSACEYGTPVGVTHQIDYRERYDYPRWYFTISGAVDITSQSGTGWKVIIEWEAFGGTDNTGVRKQSAAVQPDGTWTLGEQGAPGQSTGNEFRVLSVHVLTQDAEPGYAAAPYSLSGGALKVAVLDGYPPSTWHLPQEVGAYGTSDFYGFGTTDESVCRFYIGPPVASGPSPYTGDESQNTPWLALDAAPEPLDPAPAPPSGEPDDYTAPADEPSFWDQILRAIRALGRAISGIAGAILDGLTGLFVPDGDVIAAEVDSINGAWDDTAPMQTIDAVQDLGAAFTIAAPSGCQGPGLTFSNPLAGGGGTTVHFLDACGAEMGQFASLVKTALTVSVYVGGFLAAVRIIGGAFGLDLRLTRGED